MKSLTEQFQNSLLWQLNEKISSWTAHLIGPFVFNFGMKEEPWNIRTADLLQFPEDSVGKALGEFLKKDKLEPIAGAESHDLYHLLFDYPTTLKGENALQFFLLGNGKHSIASFGASLGAWLVFPRQWNYFRTARSRGKECIDVSKLDMKKVLHENFEKLKASLFETKNTEVHK